ncbi:MAG: AEC family transporter [Hyphomicrobiales bacterium]
MIHFLSILELTIPFFAVVGLGYAAAKTKMIDAGSAGAINVFVFYFAMPALVIGTLARQEITAILDWRFLGGWLAAALTLFALGMLAARIFFNANRREMALFGQGSAIANIGFLAIPIAGATFGAEGVRLSAAALIIDLMIMIPLSIMIIESSGGGNIGASVKRALFGAIRNPFAVAILVGVALSASGLGLPGAAATFSNFLGSAAAPTALFALGMSLSQRSLGEDIKPVVTLSVLKLFVHPAVTAVVLYFVGLPTSLVIIGTVIAAMPVAQNVYVLAEHYGTMVRRASAAILLSTVAAILTISLMLYLLTGP